MRALALYKTIAVRRNSLRKRYPSLRSLTTAANAVSETTLLIAAVNRCATHNQAQHGPFPQTVKPCPSRTRFSKPVLLILLLVIATVGCSQQRKTTALLATPTAFGSAVVETSGGKQTGEVGTLLSQPVVVQVNDEQGNAVAGALVTMRGPNGVVFDPVAGATDSSGQFTTNISLGVIPGRYQLTASTTTKAGKTVELKMEEIALGYQEMVGSQLNDQYCARCHNQESTPERVSNYDNLEVKPHPFTEGDTLNKMSDADLTAIISHGGAALNKSPLMAPYGYTLSKSEIQALIAYIRMVSDPPYGVPGIVYAQK
jgi:mono/diheme cytochrome c family protein